MFYATNQWNSRGDYLAVQLKDGSVVVTIDLGSTSDQDGSTTGKSNDLIEMTGMHYDHESKMVVIDHKSDMMDMT